MRTTRTRTIIAAALACALIGVLAAAGYEKVKRKG